MAVALDGPDRSDRPDSQCLWFKQKIKHEILESEETYVHQLNLIVKLFEQPLRDSSLVPEYVVSQIFGNISQLLNVNDELLRELKLGSVGEAFNNVSPYLKLYSSYARSHESALRALMSWQEKNPKFLEFRQRQESHEDLQGLKLNALLITPIQRIPRYKLLLEELLKHMTKTDNDYLIIEGAYKHIARIAEYINNHIKQYDNTQRMVEIQKRLQGKTTIKILQPGRIFIKESLLKKVDKNGKNLHCRMVFLFSDTLMYAKVDSSGNYSLCGTLPLHKCRVARVLCDSTRQHRTSGGGFFKVTCLDTQLLLYSSSNKEIDEWLRVLSSAISVYRQNRSSLRKESSGKRPRRYKRFVL